MYRIFANFSACVNSLKPGDWSGRSLKYPALLAAKISSSGRLNDTDYFTTLSAYKLFPAAWPNVGLSASSLLVYIHLTASANDVMEAIRRESNCARERPPQTAVSDRQRKATSSSSSSYSGRAHQLQPTARSNNTYNTSP